MVKPEDKVPMDENCELTMEPERDYDGEQLRKAYAKALDEIDDLCDRLAIAAGPNGCFADNTPVPVMKSCDEADRALAQAKSALRHVKWAIGRWELVQRTGEKF